MTALYTALSEASHAELVGMVLENRAEIERLRAALPLARYGLGRLDRAPSDDQALFWSDKGGIKGAQQVRAILSVKGTLE